MGAAAKLLSSLCQKLPNLTVQVEVLSSTSPQRSHASMLAFMQPFLFKFPDLHLCNHSGLIVSRYMAGHFDHTGLPELPDQGLGFSRLEV
jgi:hypothetical protein